MAFPLPPDYGSKAVGVSGEGNASTGIHNGKGHSQRRGRQRRRGEESDPNSHRFDVDKVYTDDDNNNGNSNHRAAAVVSDDEEEDGDGSATLDSTIGQSTLGESLEEESLLDDDEYTDDEYTYVTDEGEEYIPNFMACGTGRRRSGKRGDSKWGGLGGIIEDAKKSVNGIVNAFDILG